MDSGRQTIVFEDDTVLNKNDLPARSYYRVYWWFNRFEKKQFRKSRTCHPPPYDNAPETGIFATRSPVRPNPIATTVVKVLSVDTMRKCLEICGFDGFDKSKIIGIVPYESHVLDAAVKLPEWLAHWPKAKTFVEPSDFDQEIRLESSGLHVLDDLLMQSEDEVIAPLQEAKQADYDMKDFDSHHIHVVDANQNNLKHVDVKIPKNKITCITGGVSGSGKSSLAFDTIYTESQRQFMDIMGSDRNHAYEKPSVDRVDGLQPSIAIEQKSLGQNPRSTVGTVTGVIDYLRMLYVAIGTRHCPECHSPIDPITEEEIRQKVALLRKKIMR